ncbi:alpha/beta hydrolase [Streptomyces sp. NPDC026672]|uniref:alpha/beta hydrolase n=1 Tax=unclassified Streptomyces TaxID=2593676 RepID=UPI0033F04670
MNLKVHDELAAVVPLLPASAFDEAGIASARAAVRQVSAADGTGPTGVVLEEREVTGPPGAPDVVVRVFRPQEYSAASGAGVLDIHGGGFAAGAAVLDDEVNAHLVRALGVVVVAVGYRLAPEHPFPAPLEDCYAALTWFAANAGELGVDPARIGVLGDSAGGCLAAAVALMARDQGGPALAFQALVEPVLDDRMDTPSMREPTFTLWWSREHAKHSWRYYLGGDQLHREPSAYAAPARAAALGGLPPTYLSVNELDVLRDEGLDYARRLLEAGVPTEVHVWPGTFHGFAAAAPDSSVAHTARASLTEALRRGLGVAKGR